MEGAERDLEGIKGTQLSALSKASEDVDQLATVEGALHLLGLLVDTEARELASLTSRVV
jgi:hypothetical protein